MRPPLPSPGRGVIQCVLGGLVATGVIMFTPWGQLVSLAANLIYLVPGRVGMGLLLAVMLPSLCLHLKYSEGGPARAGGYGVIMSMLALMIVPMLHVMRPEHTNNSDFQRAWQQASERKAPIYKAPTSERELLLIQMEKSFDKQLAVSTLQSMARQWDLDRVEDLHYAGSITRNDCLWLQTQGAPFDLSVRVNGQPSRAASCGWGTNTLALQLAPTR